MPINSEMIEPLTKEIIEDIKEELRLQGHKAFGNLERSMDTFTLIEGDFVFINIIGLSYLEDIEKGVSAGDINISGSDFAKLTEWVRLRGLGGKRFSTKQIAYFIVQKWKKEGKPLDTSLKFSQTGEILHAVEIALREWNDKYILMLQEIISKYFLNKINLQIKGV